MLLLTLGRRLGVGMNKLISTATSKLSTSPNLSLVLSAEEAVSVMRCYAYWRRFSGAAGRWTR
jgi:hypothetical protein